MKKGSSILLGLTAALFAAPVSAQSYYSPDADLGQMAGFAGSLAVVDGHVLVGEGGNQIRSGIVYVYGMDGGSWVEMGQLTAESGDSGDGFGSAMAASGDHLLITSSMGVHHFHRSGETWTERGMLSTNNPVMESDGFGATIAMSGNYALIGAPGSMEGMGAAYLFHAGSNGWQEVGMVMAEGGAAGDVFGAAVALDGSTAVVGAPLMNDRMGAAYVYEASEMGLQMVSKIEADDVGNNGRFATSVWAGNDLVIASAPNTAQGRGSVRVFAMNEGEYVEGARLSAFDPAPRSAFGTAMGYTGSGYVIGAPGAGNVYHFMAEDGAIVGAEKLMNDFEGRSGFGATLAIGDGILAVGATAVDRGAGAVVIYNLSDMSSTTLQSAPEGFDAITGGEVRCEGGEAADWECSEVDLVSFLPVSTLAGEDVRGLNTNDNWGWVDPETGKEYALVGMTDRASFVDMSDPFNPVVVGILKMPETAQASSWRDIKTYQNYAYIVSDNARDHGMQVFDLTRLRDFQGGDPIFFTEDFNYDGIGSAHNIVINEESGFAYSVGSSSAGESCGGGLHMIDIREPMNPTFAGCFSDAQTGRASTGYSHDAQCVMYVGPDADYAGAEICLGSNETAISIADVSDKSNPVAISRAAYPNPGYTHQGWLTDDHRYFFVNDELDELSGIVDRTRTIIWDLTDLDDPQLVAEHLGTQESSDHNLYISGNLMYQSNYQSGLRILDVSDPANPVEVAYFDTVPYGDNGAGFGGSWSNYPYFESGVVVVTSGAEGLFLVRPTVRRTVFQ